MFVYRSPKATRVPLVPAIIVNGKSLIAVSCTDSTKGTLRANRQKIKLMYVRRVSRDATIDQDE